MTPCNSEVVMNVSEDLAACIFRVGICSSQISITVYKTTRCHNPEDHNPNFHHRENLKSRILCAPTFISRESLVFKYRYYFRVPDVLHTAHCVTDTRNFVSLNDSCECEESLPTARRHGRRRSKAGGK
jgi:hypothetical protein